MKTILSAFALVAATVGAPALAQAQTAPAAPAPDTAPAPAASPDYTNARNWLCRPGRADPCTADQSATIVKPDGSRKVETFTATKDPAFDCFYVYPTVSLDPTPNSDMNAGQEENVVAAFQAARFTKYCRVFAPIYRQVTLPGLQAVLTGRPVAIDRAMAYRDVKAAWDEYMAYDNHGRGVVLIGHSQGSGVLKTLMADAIEGTPAQKQIISVMIPGTNVAVPVGKDVGGDLKSTPLCRKASDTGCVVSYVTFRADAPPPPNTRFGGVPQPGMTAACVNPAALRGAAATADAYLGAKGAGLSSAPQGPWSSDGAPVTTPFVKVPGLLSVACTTSGRFSYLAVTVNAVPSDARTDTIVGDIVFGGGILKDWGLHLLDMPVVMGDLVELSAVQAKAWEAKQGAVK
ncbi:DUF3089 domain-containing protein [Sphingomonas sp. MMS24-J45]|uniref:DUF3089 domain-containing protein n=1 Tax=Sphingomonas sp. MMS24-J45 TaxID=3238806 RepID=UPI00384E5C9F